MSTGGGLGLLHITSDINIGELYGCLYLVEDKHNEILCPIELIKVETNHFITPFCELFFSE